MKYVFIYGTLRAGEINDINLAAARNGIGQPRLVGRTAVAGHLFDFGAYPGMIADPQAAAVIGEVYEVDDALVAVLDEIEQVYPGVDGMFAAQKVNVEVQGEQLECLFYPVARHAVKGRPQIHGGDWVAHRLGR